MLVTAPHHGSESNANAYRRFKKFKKEVGEDFDVNWIRSDGNYKDRPGPSYLDQEHRYCTICRGLIQPKQKQAVRFVTQRGSCVQDPHSPVIAREYRGHDRAISVCNYGCNYLWTLAESISHSDPQIYSHSVCPPRSVV